MSDGDPNPESDIETIATEVLGVLSSGRQIAPFSDRYPAFDLAAAYRVTDALRRMREARGLRPVGRKIGFTNPTVWDEIRASAPMWGFMSDRTVRDLTAGTAVSLAGLAEPRIEPEIVFGLGAAPEPGMDERALLGCIEWVAHGFEIAQSVFPRWEFALPDTVAVDGLHGLLVVGPRRTIAPDVAAWERTLATFEIDLMRDGEVVARGRSANVLGGPVSALRHLVAVLATDPVNPPLAAGEIVTTGTLTRALPVASGQTWTTRLSGIALDGIALRCA